MYGEQDVRLLGELLFDGVGEVVRRHQRHMRVHLDVYGRVQLVLPVAVHGQIVQPVHARKGAHPRLDVAQHLRVRRRAQQARDRLFEDASARKGDEHRDRRAHVAVQIKVRIVGHDQRHDDRRRRHRVRNTVRRRGAQRFRVQLLSPVAVEEEEEELRRDRRRQHGDQRPRKVARLRRKDLLHRFDGQLRRHHQHDQRDHERGDRLRPPVPEGVFFIRGLFAHFQADQRDDVAPAVGQVVHAVRQHGQRARHRPQRDLRRREQGIDGDADPARERAHPRAPRRRRPVLFHKKDLVSFPMFLLSVRFLSVCRPFGLRKG